MKNRYEIIKKLYPNYLILINHKNNLISFKNDKIILKYFNIKKKKVLYQKHINYLILNNLEIEEIKDYQEENKYYLYLLRACLITKIKARFK